MIDIKPYENFLSKLSDDLRKAGIAAHTVDQLYESPSKEVFKSVITGLKSEIVALQEDKVNNVDSLAKNQEEIIDENISGITVTRVEISENRQAISKIIRSLSLLDSKIGNITQALEREVFQVSQFFQLYLQLDSVIQAIRTIWWAASFMEHIYIYMLFFFQGNCHHSGVFIHYTMLL